MPRWSKSPADYDADIEKSLAKIQRHTKLLEEEQVRLEDLRAKKRDAELQEIYDFMRDHDLAAGDVVQILNEYHEDE